MEVVGHRDSDRREQDQRSRLAAQLHHQRAHVLRPCGLDLVQPQEREQLAGAGLGHEFHAHRLVDGPQIDHDGRLEIAEGDPKQHEDR